MPRVLRCLPLLLGLSLLSACASTRPEKPAPVPELKPGRLVGYLEEGQKLDALSILPAPPAPGSAMSVVDEAFNQAALTLKGSSRWQLAARDADVNFPQAASTYACSLNAPISEQSTPYLYQILRRVASDAGYAGSATKEKYKRQRPFLFNHQGICTPEDETKLRTEWSYPSGHSATGQIWGLILAELAPDRAEAILTRAQAYAQSRVICNVHWQSDTIEGRYVGAYVYSRLQGNAEFRSDMAAAREELKAVRAKGLPPNNDCAAETEALKTVLPVVGWPNAPTAESSRRP